MNLTSQNGRERKRADKPKPARDRDRSLPTLGHDIREAGRDLSVAMALEILIQAMGRTHYPEYWICLVQMVVASAIADRAREGLEDWNEFMEGHSTSP